MIRFYTPLKWIIPYTLTVSFLTFAITGNSKNATEGKKELYYCSVEVENPFPLQHGFITYFLTRKVSDILLQTGWVQNCEKGQTVRVVVKSVSYEGASISGNRFGGYRFKIAFSVILPHRTLNYSFSRYVSLSDPSLGTYPIRSALADIFDTYQLKIKRDLIFYESTLEKLELNGSTFENSTPKVPVN